MGARFQGRIDVDQKVGGGTIRTQLGAFAIAMSGLSVGRRAGEPVTDDSPGETPHEFTGGMSFNVSGEPYVDLGCHAEMLLKSQ